ncbi:hypothetical protein DFH07DRAFT_979690 [Mycena maculata]|uniref:Cullin N-terminal domain-containing protein n=1 Tax=Mycena maculata TaxID=230809 RepID=A0AAD7IJH1_9AGAR|nr:hypothetical protein DFH07DRAFT_979690 [Mycena maculata]
MGSYTTGANYLNRLFAYLNRYWVKCERNEGKKAVYQVDTLALAQWRQHLLQPPLASAIMRLVAAQREGAQIGDEPHDRPGAWPLNKVVDTFVSLGLDAADPNSCGRRRSASCATCTPRRARTSSGAARTCRCAPMWDALQTLLDFDADDRQRMYALLACISDVRATRAHQRRARAAAAQGGELDQQAHGDALLSVHEKAETDDQAQPQGRGGAYEAGCSLLAASFRRSPPALSNVM